MKANELGFEITLSQPFDQAIETVTAALKTEGFGVLTRIDVQATMKEKLGADFRPYVILGACNPGLAHKALSHAPEVGLLLPCNVTVEENAPGQALVRIVNPATMVLGAGRPGDPVLQEVADEATQRMEKVVRTIEAVRA
jgi:uncharacterized protein (DUF302 family)